VHFASNSFSARSEGKRIRREVRLFKKEKMKMSDNGSNQSSGTPPVSTTAPQGNAPAAPQVNTPTTPQGNAPVALNLREAYDKTLQASLALEEATLLPVNVDLPTAVTTAVGAMPQILAQRDRVKDELPKFDLSHFDQLEQFALAAAHAHGNFLAASSPPEALLDLNTKGMAMRDMLYTDAVALAGRGLISGDRIGDFKANVGYKNVTYDLIGLASLLRQNWDKISTRTGIQASELDAAEALAGQLISALSAREQTPAIVAGVAVQRQRNFTLFAQAYDQARRAISYLRWDNEDLERIAPSLYGGRIVKKKGDDTQPGATTPAAGNAGDAAASGSTTTPHPAPVAGVTTPSTASGTKPAPATAASGLPGASPFAGLS
jgi:hypothetical protein